MRQEDHALGYLEAIVRYLTAVAEGISADNTDCRIRRRCQSHRFRVTYTEPTGEPLGIVQGSQLGAKVRTISRGADHVATAWPMGGQVH